MTTRERIARLIRLVHRLRDERDAARFRERQREMERDAAREEIRRLLIQFDLVKLEMARIRGQQKPLKMFEVRLPDAPHDIPHENLAKSYYEK